MISSSKEANTYNNSPKIKKWIILFSFCLNSISSVFLFNAFSPIWSQVAIYYRTDDYNLNWFSNCYFLLPIVLTLVLNPIILKYYGGSQIISCITTSLGLWIIYIAQRNYNIGLLGFIFIGLGQSLYFHVPLHLSKLWFEPDERIVSTFIGQYSSNFGLLLGYLVSAIYFYNETDQKQFNKRFPNIIFFNAILSTMSIPLSIITLQKPNDMKNKILQRDSIWKSIKIVCSKQESLFDILAVSTFIGYGWCYPTLFSVQQLMIGQNSLDIIINSINFQIGQIVAAFFSTYKLQKQARQGLQLGYDKLIKQIIGSGFLFLVIEILVFENLPYFILVGSNFVIGAGLGGLYSVLLESLMEKHYPVQELAISSLLEIGACAFALVITMILVIPEFLQFGFQIYSFIMILPFCYIFIFYTTKFKRFEYEG
ncbi:unnamed protein product [Paramecium pentaurelia]|uniref:Uncharacterized protein n=1 Tax=Paramecium pentaurelia TaxID=43138 RepID=A0A8S1VX96_9CILI|nr:unnamed protein product [Paramecium pentaurelia]